MRTVLQFAAVTALGLVVSWFAALWFGLFENSDAAFFVGMAGLLAIGYLVDRRTARRQRQSQDWRSTGRPPALPRE